VEPADPAAGFPHCVYQGFAEEGEVFAFGAQSGSVVVRAQIGESPDAPLFPRVDDQRKEGGKR
jgi:hypothetical protein